MEDDLDHLLKAPLLEPPPDFEALVMARIHQAAQQAPVPRRQPLWQWLALAAAGLPVLLQLFAFIFGMWAATAAG
jgi:hypothetical protein